MKTFIEAFLTINGVLPHSDRHAPRRPGIQQPPATTGSSAFVDDDGPYEARANASHRGFLISAALLIVACKFRAYSTAPAVGMSGPLRMYSLALVSEMRGAFSMAAMSLSTCESSCAAG